MTQSTTVAEPQRGGEVQSAGMDALSTDEGKIMVVRGVVPNIVECGVQGNQRSRSAASMSRPVVRSCLAQMKGASGK